MTQSAPNTREQPATPTSVPSGLRPHTAWPGSHSPGDYLVPAASTAAATEQATHSSQAEQRADVSIMVNFPFELLDHLPRIFVLYMNVVYKTICLVAVETLAPPPRRARQRVKSTCRWVAAALRWLAAGCRCLEQRPARAASHDRGLRICSQDCADHRSDAQRPAKEQAREPVLRDGARLPPAPFSASLLAVGSSSAHGQGTSAREALARLAVTVNRSQATPRCVSSSVSTCVCCCSPPLPGCTQAEWLTENAAGKETPLFAPFTYEMYHFTKTGPGRT